MADNKTTETKVQKKPYTYIDTDIDSDLLVKNLKHNAQSYVKAKGWDESKAREFYAALTEFENAIDAGRLSSDQSGSIIDSGGILNNGAADWRDKNGKVLSHEEYEGLKKRDKKKATRDFYSNREVASYLNTIAKGLYTKQIKAKKPEEAAKAKFDLSKHGLWSKFVLSMAPNGNGDLDAWLDLDPLDTKTNKRGTTNRAKKLSDYITNYIQGFGDNLDFTDSTISKEDYLQNLNALQQELANGVTAADYRILNQLGASPEEYRSFFTTEKKYLPEGAEGIGSGAAAGGSSATTGDDDATKARLNKRDQEYRKKYNSAGFKHYSSKTAPTGVKYDTTAKDRVTAYQNALNANNIRFSVDNLRKSNGSNYLNYLEQYGELNPGAVQSVTVGKYTGWNYIPESVDDTNGSVLAYNPGTHTVGRIFLGDAGPQAVQLYQNILRQGDSWDQSASKPMFQEGGVTPEEPIGYMGAGVATQEPTGYAAGSAVAMFDQAQQQLSEKTKNDPKLRQPWKKETNYSSNNLTTTDMARLGAIAADIAALVDPEPISAGILGVGSDVTNLVADLSDGVGFGTAIGNFGANLGLSAIGLIPVIGDAAGSGTKVVKSLVKLAPKVTKYLTAAGLLAGVANSGEIIHSFSKIGKDGPENEMNMQDWRNIGTGIQLILGEANAYRNVKAAKKVGAAKLASETGHVDVRVKDKSGQGKVLRFGGKKDVKALKAAKTPDEVNAVINSHPSMKDKYSVETNTETGHAWLTQGSTWYKPWSWRQKTSTDVLTGTAVSPVYSAKKFASIYTPSKWGRDRYLGVTRQKADEFVKYDYNPNATTRAERGKARFDALKQRGKNPNPAPANPPVKPTINPPAGPKPQPGSNKGQGYSGPRKNPQKTPEYTQMQDATLINRAKTYRQSLNNVVSKKHSPEFNELLKRGNTSAQLRSMGIWQLGGKLVRKCQAGTNTSSFLSTDFSLFPKKKSPLELSVPELKLPELNLPFTVRRNLEQNKNTLQYTSTPNYGTGYTSSRDYSNGEYGTTDKVNISAIRDANAGRRDRALHPKHLADNYNYGDAQGNTDRARSVWQSNASNRTTDFMTWVRNWRTKNPNGTQADMLAAYNNLIDSMYDYKREMGTSPYTGKGSYRKGAEVSKFNQTNKAIYGSANSATGVHGYSIPQENVNGTTTAQRFIDITPENISDLNFTFNDNDTDEFRSLFSGLTKDKTGRYYVTDKKLVIPEIKHLDPSLPPIDFSKPQPKTPDPSSVDPAEETPEGGKTKPKFSLPSLIDILPEALQAGRFFATGNLNKKLYDIARQMPVNLYNPKEAQRWVTGDYNAIQRARQAAGQLNYLASQPVTPSAENWLAGALEAQMKGFSNFLLPGYDRDYAAVQQTSENVWDQERANQTSRYNTTLKNSENLFNKRVSDLTALGQMHRANYEGLNSILSGLETTARAKRDENMQLQETATKANLQNEISANMADYGIPATPEEQQLFNDLQSGTRELSSLSDAERAAYTRLSNEISEAVTQRTLAAKGIIYKPFRANPANTGWTPTFIDFEKKGGVLGEDSEKVTIQKLKGRLKQMEIYQRHLEKRLDAFEKDADRAYKSASSYVRGQKRSK